MKGGDYALETTHLRFCFLLYLPRLCFLLSTFYFLL